MHGILYFEKTITIKTQFINKNIKEKNCEDSIWYCTTYIPWTRQCKVLLSATNVELINE